MGNACGCADGNVGDAQNTNITLSRPAPEPFRLATHKTLITPEAFVGLSGADKDQMLVDVLRLIVTRGDAAQIKTNNVHLKKELVKQTQKVVLNGDIFDGEVIDGIANGRGKVKLISGGDFEGYFIGGYRRAKGVTKHPNLTEESAYGEEGQPEGISIHKAANGSQQTFFYERGLRNGLAFSETAAEQQFEPYIANRRNGVTVKIAKDHKTLILQEFKDDKPNGVATEYGLKDAKAAPQPAPQAPAPQPGQAAPQPGPAAPQPGQAAPAQTKPVDPKAAAPQEKGPAPAPIQQTQGQPAPVKPTPQTPEPQKA